MSLEEKEESSDQPIETAKDEPVNKRGSQEVDGGDSSDHQSNENNDDTNPQKKKPRRQEEEQDNSNSANADGDGDDEEEDAVTKARKVLEMFRKEFGEDDEGDDAKPATGSGEKDGSKGKAADPANTRFQRKPIILQDDDPCLL